MHFQEVRVIGRAVEAENIERRVLAGKVVDFSGSMYSYRDAVLRSFTQMLKTICSCALDRLRIELAFCPFATEVILHSFRPAPFYLQDKVSIPSEGCTSLGAALTATIQATDQRRQTLESEGITVLQSVILVVTDGLATDSMDQAMELIERHQASIQFIPIAASAYDVKRLQAIFHTDPILLDRLDFSAIFRAFSQSLSQYSCATQGYEPSARQLMVTQLNSPELPIAGDK